MAETGFAGQHVTTTTTMSSTMVQTNVRFDPGYLRTVPGILKAAQVLLNLLGFICIQISVYSYFPESRYFSWISMIAFFISGILLGLYLFHLVEKFYSIPWLKIEFGFCALWAILYVVASSIAASTSAKSSDNPSAAAAFFGFAAMLAYGIDAYRKWTASRAGELAQGTRVVSKQTTRGAVAPPREAY